MNNQKHDLEIVGDGRLQGEQEEEKSGIKSVSPGRCEISRETTEAGSKAKRRWRAAVSCSHATRELLKNKIELFYGWANSCWLLEVMHISCVSLLRIIVGLGQVEVQMQGKSFNAKMLAIKPVWTALYWRRDRVVTWQPRSRFWGQLSLCWLTRLLVTWAQSFF